jgi:hypothetical protein
LLKAETRSVVRIPKGTEVDESDTKCEKQRASDLYGSKLTLWIHLNYTPVSSVRNSAGSLKSLGEI